ncbi:CopG family transcriptional regulator [Ornithinimicrobium ciconiae]|uniref:CopG family transcriptional regulator n=1 Tax=Ornithinimicrobium ciconiae TaxID=2594265 RepID=A0A516G959_9MICO|nr:CopG family transcriptional regulator [Ornithinimicrobium ciconiae]QDO88064.1 CopG family transcriptional regulator [Ornithinimicrobium ciconiae]
MRTTVRLDPEVAAAAERLRRERHIGLGEAVNELARAGLERGQRTTRFRQRTANVGLKIDVTNVADALEQLDAYDVQTER